MNYDEVPTGVGGGMERVKVMREIQREVVGGGGGD